MAIFFFLYCRIRFVIAGFVFGLLLMVVNSGAA